MEKKKYSAPELELVSLMDEMPVLCSSGGGGGGKLGGFKASAGSLIMAALLVCVGCEKKVMQPACSEESNSGKVQMSFTCSGEMGGGLKVAVDTEKGDCVWESSDKIAIVNDKGESAEFTLTSGAGTNSGVFQGEITPSEGDDYYAVYPASAVISASGDGKLICSVPQTQRYVLNSVDKVIPFVGRAIGENINFTPAMSIIRIGVKGDRSVAKATLTGGGNEAFAGEFSIDCSQDTPAAVISAYGKDMLTLNCETPVELNNESDTYFSFAVPAGSFSKGFTVTLYDTDGETAVISTSKDNTIGVCDMKYINNIMTSFSKNYLTFTADADGSVLSLVKNGTPADATLYYSTDGTTWSLYTFGNQLTINKGEFVKFKGVNSSFSTGNYDYYCFNITGSVKASGSIMSLVSADTEDDEIPNEYCFYGLFYNCTGLTTAPEMNATTLKACCYCSMFKNCTSLKKAPALPATTLPDGRLQPLHNGKQDYDGVYSFMFDGCTSLVYTPELPAKNLGTYAYQGMFRNCKSLITTQNLDFGEVPDGGLGVKPGGTTTNGCCASMFQGCTSLRDAPVISYTKAGKYAFSYIFYNCTSLTKVVLNNGNVIGQEAMLGAFMYCTKLSDVTVANTQWCNDYYWWWMYGVAANGTFHCPQQLINNTDHRDHDTVPAGWSMVAVD